MESKCLQLASPSFRAHIAEMRSLCVTVYASSVPHREAETWVWVWLRHWSSDERHSLLPLLFSLTGLQEPDVIWKHFDLKPLFEPVKERFVLLLVCRELHAAVDTTLDLEKMSLGNGTHTCTHWPCCILVYTMTVNLHKVWMVTMGLQTDNGPPGFPMLMLHQKLWKHGYWISTQAISKLLLETAMVVWGKTTVCAGGTASKTYQALWPLKSSVQPPTQSFLISNFPSIQTLAQWQNTVALHIKLSITQLAPLTCGLTVEGAVRVWEAGQHIICGACSVVYHWLIFPAVLL